MEDNRPSVYQEDSGLVVYRASALGQCSASLLEYRMGENEPMPHPQWLLDRFESGKRNESVILNLLYDPKWGHPWKSMGGGQLEVELPVGEGVIVRGHLDDMAIRIGALSDRINTPVGEVRVVEAKKFGPSYWDTWQTKGLAGFPLYEFQLSIYMHATGKKALFVVGQSEADEKDPENRAADVVKRIVVKEVDEPPVSLGQIKLKVARIEAQYQQGKRFDECDIRQYPCPWYHLLHEAEPESASRDWELEATLRASADLERLNEPAEMQARATRLRAESEGLFRQAREYFQDWFNEHPTVTDREFRTKKWIIRRQASGVEVRPRPEVEVARAMEET